MRGDHRRADSKPFQSGGDLRGLVARSADEARTAAEAMARPVDQGHPRPARQRVGRSDQPVMMGVESAMEEQQVGAAPLPERMEAPAGAEIDGL